MSNHVKEIVYKKDNGKVSKRLIFDFNPSEHMLVLDLSQFPEKEVRYYVEQLEMLMENMRDDIKDLGLSSCYRTFKRENIINE